MALQVTSIDREFSFQKGKETIKLPDPGHVFTPAEVAKHYATKHPELTTATVEGPVVNNDKAAYSFKTTVGTKG